MRIRRQLFTVLAMIGVVTAFAAPTQASTAAEPDFTRQALDAGLTAGQAAQLQERVDEVLSDIPGGKQVSANEISYDGLDVAVDPLHSEEAELARIDCDEGWFCIQVRDTRFDFYKCRTWELSNWSGISPYNNNQSSGAVARAYGQDGSSVVFRNVAKSTGSEETSPWWYFRPC